MQAHTPLGILGICRPGRRRLYILPIRIKPARGRRSRRLSASPGRCPLPFLSMSESSVSDVLGSFASSIYTGCRISGHCKRSVEAQGHSPFGKCRRGAVRHPPLPKVRRRSSAPSPPAPPPPQEQKTHGRFRHCGGSDSAYYAARGAADQCESACFLSPALPGFVPLGSSGYGVFVF